MKLILEKDEALTIIFSALCNGGLSDLSSCGVQLNVSDKDYAKAKAELKKTKKNEGICMEDVWVQILRSGKALQFRDHEGEEDVEFTLEKAMEEMGKEDAMDDVLTTKNEEDDATTGFNLLQYCMYGEVIYG